MTVRMNYKEIQWLEEDYYKLRNKYDVAIKVKLMLKEKVDKLERDNAFLKQEYNGLKDRYDILVKKNGELVKKLKEKEND